MMHYQLWPRRFPTAWTGAWPFEWLLSRRPPQATDEDMDTSLSSGRKFGGKTADERRAERRSQLLHAGIKAYGEKGYRNTTVKAVCDGAGLTERYFYESFSNSEELLCAGFRYVTDEILVAMQRAAEAQGGDYLARVRAGLLVYLRRLQDKPAAARVFLIEMASVSPQTEALMSEALDKFGALLVDVLQQQPGREGKRNASPLLVRGVVGGGLHMAQTWISSGYAEDIEVVADTALRLYALAARP